MGLEFLQRVRKTSIVTGLVVLPVVSAYVGLAAGVAWALGVTWSLVNVYVIGLLVRFAYTDGKKERLRAALLFVVKIPVLYLIGYLLLRSDRLPDPGLLAGFMWPLSVIVLKAFARLILRMDERKQTPYDAEPDVMHGDK
ncbi:MAG: hypothetical protein ACE5EO_00200 [Candidatus Krumholzibacteriia bacterium]